jgi:hypothetical protein
VLGTGVDFPNMGVALVPYRYSLTASDWEFLRTDPPVIVAQNPETAKCLLAELPFTLVVSDLFLFDDTDRYWEEHRDDYFRHIDFDLRSDQIVQPRGLSLVQDIRALERGSLNWMVPVIVMTFFWNHPRFATYRKSLELDAVVCLPKYTRLRCSLDGLNEAERDEVRSKGPVPSPEHILAAGDEAFSCLWAILRFPDHLQEVQEVKRLANSKSARVTASSGRPGELRFSPANGGRDLGEGGDDSSLRRRGSSSSLRAAHLRCKTGPVLVIVGAA